MSGSWRLADRLSRLLQPDERDAVHGDLAESGESGREALFELLGLVARREAGLWRDWRPWAALLGLALLAFWLTRESARLAHWSAIYLWMYVDNWRMADARSSGYWRLLMQSGAPILLSCSMLMVWSWAAGIAVGVLARRTAVVHAVLFCVALALADLSPATRGSLGPNAVVFTLRFYRSIYPLLLQAAVIALPALWGMRLGQFRVTKAE
jgi:hypothetical protein